jgi:hypothetical protein
MKFVARLDTKASRAPDKLFAQQVLDQDERKAWARFK